MLFIRTLIIVIAMIAASKTSANDHNSDNIYVPPPLFTAPSVQKRPMITDEVVPISKDKKLEQDIIQEVDPVKVTAPYPPKIPPKKLIRKAVVAPTPPTKKDLVTFSNGVVTGRKTMPAVKAKYVDKEKTFHNSNAPQTDILARVKENMVSKRVSLSPPHNKPARQDFNPAEKPVLFYQPGKTDVSVRQKEFIQHNILTALQVNPDWRLDLIVFASSNKLGLNSDRRIALSRALSIRSFLMGHGIKPGRIDVKALGAKTTETPMDRVEFSFQAS